MKHLVFYDGTCGLCDRTVQCLLQIDKKEQFVFAPLQGETAKRLLQHLPKQEDSLILVENYDSSDPHYFLLGKAVFRICWLLGGGWLLLGWLSFFPSFVFASFYRFVARHRHRFFGQNVCLLPQKSHPQRFLP